MAAERRFECPYLSRAVWNSGGMITLPEVCLMGAGMGCQPRPSTRRHLFACSCSSRQDLTMQTELEAVNGKKMQALEVFAHALRFFKQHAVQVGHPGTRARVSLRHRAALLSLPKTGYKSCTSSSPHVGCSCQGGVSLVTCCFLPGRS